jgi:hypothetical protein
VGRGVAQGQRRSQLAPSAPTDSREAGCSGLGLMRFASLQRGCRLSAVSRHLSPSTPEYCQEGHAARWLALHHRKLFCQAQAPHDHPRLPTDRPLGSARSSPSVLSPLVPTASNMSFKAKDLQFGKQPSLLLLLLQSWLTWCRQLTACISAAAPR